MAILCVAAQLEEEVENLALTFIEKESNKAENIADRDILDDITRRIH